MLDWYNRIKSEKNNLKKLKLFCKINFLFKNFEFFYKQSQYKDS